MDELYDRAHPDCILTAILIADHVGDEDQGRTKHLTGAVHMVFQDWPDKTMCCSNGLFNGVADYLQLCLDVRLIVPKL